MANAELHWTLRAAAPSEEHVENPTSGLTEVPFAVGERGRGGGGPLPLFGKLLKLRLQKVMLGFFDKHSSVSVTPAVSKTRSCPV